MKHCNGCDLDKPTSMFAKRTRRGREGLNPRCKACNSSYRASRTDYEREYRKQWRSDNKEVIKEKSKYKHIRFYYGLSKDAYVALLANQNGKCAICEIDLTTCSRSVVDHDHGCCPDSKTCGSCVRGILCVPCNTGIGMLKDDYHTLQRALEYLRVPSEEA